MEISIFGAKEDLALLWSELERHGSDGTWSLERELSRQYTEELHLSDNEAILFFDCATEIPPRSRLVLSRKPDRIAITNIVPRTVNSLEDAQYERVAAAFFAQVVARTKVGPRVSMRES